ncbi:molybdopterin biosynthesis protein MoeY [Pseudoduganella violacea]|uniref:Molybdopterin biosynthesis protein MoeY n=1 Tax=Pseudoduganella violacea TaxID=1715466 RepID=A0A7W5FWF7_9BURK|nr:molybdopterin biosynthesis protein MoeY [Pseudoduganella violacea]MBB3121970.1 hypothetical protein [Pseudoduganella violacea]
MSAPRIIEQILDLARWAPSGDNVQTHRFEILDEQHVRIHASDTSAHCVYDLDGHASQIAFGALLETMAIAASEHGWRMDFTRQQRAPEFDSELIFDVAFTPQPGLQPDALIPSIAVRAVQRRAMRTRPLSPAEKQEMEAAAGAGYRIRWLETPGERWQAAQLMFHNAKLRLTMPEAFEVHRRIIHWGVSHSEDRVPDQALGVDALTLRLMKWAMASNWGRMATMNTLFGTWLPRLQMDLLPGLLCGAHFVLQARQPLRSIDDHVAAGRAVQRFWLTLTRLGLFMQPEMTPLIFARYIAEGRAFTREAAVQARAERLRPQAVELMGGENANAVFIGRLGAGPAPAARAVRKPLAELMQR